MILDVRVLKRLIKEAADGPGLTIVNTGEELHLRGNYWMINIDRSRMSDKALAAVIEIAGELPEEGEAFTAYSSGDKQMEMDLENTGLKKIINRYDVKETSITVAGKRVLTMQSFEQAKRQQLFSSNNPGAALTKQVNKGKEPMRRIIERVRYTFKRNHCSHCCIWCQYYKTCKQQSLEERKEDEYKRKQRH